MSSLVVLVHSDPEILQGAETVLHEAGCAVVSASSFQAARKALECVEPDLLIADIRLDDFNGLHLAILSRLERPRMPVIITHAYADAILEGEARRCDAAFVVNPLGNPEFVPAIRAALASRASSEVPQ